MVNRALTAGAGRAPSASTVPVKGLRELAVGPPAPSPAAREHMKVSEAALDLPQGVCGEWLAS